MKLKKTIIYLAINNKLKMNNKLNKIIRIIKINNNINFNISNKRVKIYLDIKMKFQKIRKK